MQKKLLFVLLCSLLTLPPCLSAEETDPVLQTIEKALQEYKNQDFTNAASNLEYATQLIRQKKGAALGEFLPSPFAGWTATDIKAEVTAAALFGGGLTAERSYNKDDSTVQISIVTDSPLLQSMIMMFSNPMFASAAGNFELINGYRGIVSYQENGGDVNIIVNNRFLVTLNGRNISREGLIDYAKAIDLKGIAALP